MKEAESFEVRRKVGQRLFALVYVHIQAVGETASVKTRGPQNGGDDFVHRNESLDEKRAFSLMHQLGGHVCLAVQALAQERRSESRGEGTGVGLVHVVL